MPPTSKEIAEKIEAALENPKDRLTLVDGLLNNPQFPIEWTDDRGEDYRAATILARVLPALFRSDGDQFALVAALAREVVAFVSEAARVESKRADRGMLNEMRERLKRLEESREAQATALWRHERDLKALEMRDDANAVRLDALEAVTLTDADAASLQAQVAALGVADVLRRLAAVEMELATYPSADVLLTKISDLRTAIDTRRPGVEQDSLEAAMENVSRVILDLRTSERTSERTAERKVRPQK